MAADQHEDDWNEIERAALARLRRDRRPPVELENRVMQAIAGVRGDSAGRVSRTHRIAMVALAAAAGLVLGIWIGTTWLGPAPASSGLMPASSFMLLLYEDDGYEAASDPAARVREYTEWAAGLARKGALVSGNELGGAGVVLTKAAAATSLAASQRGTQPTGYFVIATRDQVEATQVATTCPHLKYGGRVIVLPILN